MNFLPTNRSWPIPGAERRLKTAFCRTGQQSFCGFVFDPEDLSQKFVVEILVDGYPLKIIRADLGVSELLQKCVGDGHYGFLVNLDHAGIHNCAVIEARLVNVGTIVGAAIELTRSLPPDSSIQTSCGSLQWLGGLRFSGWITEPDVERSVFVDGAFVMRVRPASWSHVGTSGPGARVVRALDFHLPQQFADGRVHQLELFDDLGGSVEPAPVVFVAFFDGLRAAIGENAVTEQDKLRAQLFDRMLPMSVPFTDYQTYKQHLTLSLEPTSSSPPCAIILAGATSTASTADTLESLKKQSHTAWIASPSPAETRPLELDAQLAQRFLSHDAAACEFVIFALSGTVFEPAALQRIVAAFAKFKDARVVYGDVDVRVNHRTTWPLALSAFDYERLLEQGYCAHLFALRKDAAIRSLKSGASDVYRVFNSLLDDERSAFDKIVHLPGSVAVLPDFDRNKASIVLAAASSQHLNHRRIAASVSPRRAGVLPAVQIVNSGDRPRTTIIVPTRNCLSSLKACIQSVQPAAARLKAQILVADNESSDLATLVYFTEIERHGATVLRVGGVGNLARLLNNAAAKAGSEVLCFLNHAVTATDDQWLDQMLSKIIAPDVGAVGALLVQPSGTVAHSHVVLGPRFASADAFIDRLDSDVGYGDLLSVGHECSAVSAACLVTRRQDFVSVGGMDEIRFPVDLPNVDYCLKLRAAGKRIVFTPHAKLITNEAASAFNDGLPERKKCFERELLNLRAKWGSVLAADPYYSPILSRDAMPYSALAWPPGSLEPRLNQLPVPLQVPPGF